MRKRYKILFPLALIFQFIISIRNFLFDIGIFKSKEYSTPIISVGNITVGGTGKTPHVLYLIKLLNEKYTLATLSRGYKRKTKGFRKATETSTAKEIGDEPKLIKKTNKEITVAVDSNRVKGIDRLLNEDDDLDVILLDDAFQHRWVKPSLSILLIDYNRPLETDYYLPYGSLREGRKQIIRANIVIITKTPIDVKPMEQRVIYKNLDLFPYQNLFFTYMDYKNLRNIFNPEKEFDIKSLNEHYDVFVLTGIARPEHMIKYLSESKAKLHHLNYPDHHNFSKKDILQIIDKFNAVKNTNKLLITTEKDAMKLNEYDEFSATLKEKSFYLPIEVKFFNEQEEPFRKLIINHLNGNAKLLQKRGYNFN